VIVTAIKQGEMQKTRLYAKTMLGLWIPVFVIIALTAAGKIDPGQLGLAWVHLGEYHVFFYIMASVAALYFLYLLYTLTALRINAIRKIEIKQKIPDSVKILLPVTKREKGIWVLTAVTAGITEELLFRGFLLYLLGALFPGLSILIILCITVVIFGIGHLYQGWTEALRPALLGLIFGLFAIAFGSILPGILLHIMQDLCAVDMLPEGSGETAAAPDDQTTPSA
jgi:membrane protease YdiL (CAAX protease family)